MDNRTLIQGLAKATGLDTRTAQERALTLASLIGQNAAEGDSTAIPGFGTFLSVRTPEHVVTNKETSTRTLVPPAITVEFHPGTALKKKIGS